MPFMNLIEPSAGTIHEASCLKVTCDSKECSLDVGVGGGFITAMPYQQSTLLLVSVIMHCIDCLWK